MRLQQEKQDNVTEINGKARVQSSSTHACPKLRNVVGLVTMVRTVDLFPRDIQCH